MSYRSGKIGNPTILKGFLASTIILIGLSACGGGALTEMKTITHQLKTNHLQPMQELTNLLTKTQK